MDNTTALEELILKVQSNSKYASITPGLVRRLSKAAISKGLSGKAAVKDVRNKCHQIGGAYFRRRVDYDEITNELTQLPRDLNSDAVKQFCRKTMEAHASTRERLPILEHFFETCLEPIAPITSVQDLACGLTPLAIQWIPLADGFRYHACDIYLDMLRFLHSFFTHFMIDGATKACDLIGEMPQEPTQVAFLLKSIPCLEQVDKDIGLTLLENIQAEHILVSFPVSSLSGRNKGMPDFYETHFYEMISGKPWKISPFNFKTELAFLVTK